MFANHMPDGINFQGPEGNLYIFCQKKRKSSMDMLTQKRGRWLGELYFTVSGSPSLSNSLPFSLYYFQTYKALSFLFPQVPMEMDLLYRSDTTACSCVRPCCSPPGPLLPFPLGNKRLCPVRGNFSLQRKLGKLGGCFTFEIVPSNHCPFRFPIKLALLEEGQHSHFKLLHRLIPLCAN